MSIRPRSALMLVLVTVIVLKFLIWDISDADFRIRFASIRF
jgi:hypothetical protein